MLRKIRSFFIIKRRLQIIRSIQNECIFKTTALSCVIPSDVSVFTYAKRVFFFSSSPDYIQTPPRLAFLLLVSC